MPDGNGGVFNKCESPAHTAQLSLSLSLSLSGSHRVSQKSPCVVAWNVIFDAHKHKHTVTTKGVLSGMGERRQ